MRRRRRRCRRRRRLRRRRGFRRLRRFVALKSQVGKLLLQEVAEGGVTHCLAVCYKVKKKSGTVFTNLYFLPKLRMNLIS